MPASGRRLQMEAGYTVKLVNTVAVKTYDGLKYTGDEHDARHLAHLLRLGLLPRGDEPVEFLADNHIARLAVPSTDGLGRRRLGCEPIKGWSAIVR